MKKSLKIYHLFFIMLPMLFYAGTSDAGDNFGLDLTKKQMMPNYQSQKQPRMQSMPSVPVATAPTPQTISSPPAPTYNTNLNSQLPPENSLVSQLSTLDKLKNPKITVPNFEEKYKKMLQAAQEKAAKKKRKLSEALLEEIDRYGIYINVLLIILIMAYVVYKERWKTTRPDHPPEDENKDIWHEDF